MLTRALVLRSLLAVCVAALQACAGEQAAPPEAAAPERVENPDLGVAIADLPDGFDLVTNSGATLELEREPGLPSGRAWVEVGEPVEGGVNLVEIIRGERAAFEALPGGAFSGNGELVLPDGRPAYYSRGRFTEDGTVMEEFRVRSVHPVESERVLLVVYRYPVREEVEPREEAAQRLEDLLYLVGEIEGLATEGAARAEPEPA